jgi:hypothetical protein
MAVQAYEAYIRQEPWRFIEEGDKFFMDAGNVKTALRDLTQRLDEASIPYALVGALALGQHGMPRFTVDVDVLITKQGLATFREKYEGLGYVPAFSGATKAFRSTETGVRIDFITTGEYPGDGKPKAVAFPDPAVASVEIDGIRVIALERFVELKLTSGMTAAHRRKDLADIQALIRGTNLPLELAERLDQSVRPMYRQLWEEAQIPDPLGHPD